MRISRRAWCLAAGLLLLTAAGRLAAEPPVGAPPIEQDQANAAAANGPAALPGVMGPDPAPPVLPATPPADPTPALTRAPAPESASRPLGRPAGLFEPGPADGKTEGTADGVPAWLDPGRGEVVRVLAALVAVVGLILLMRVVIRRAGGIVDGGRPSGVVEVLARYPLARGQHLVLLKLARRILLLHQSRAGVTPVTELTDPEEVASLLARIEAGSRGRVARRFSSVLRRFESEHETAHGLAAEPAGQPGSAEIVDLTRSARPRRGSSPRSRRLQP